MNDNTPRDIGRTDGEAQGSGGIPSGTVTDQAESSGTHGLGVQVNSPTSVVGNRRGARKSGPVHPRNGADSGRVGGTTTDNAGPPKTARNSRRGGEVLAEQLAMSVNFTGMLQTVDVSGSKSEIAILSRQVPGQEKAWLDVLTKLLKSRASSLVDLLICRKYLIKNNRLVFGWYISLRGINTASVQEACTELKAVLAKARPSLEDTKPSTPQVNVPRVLAQEPASAHGGLRVISRSRDARGNVVTEEEFPIPHVYGMMNIPNEKGKGVLVLNEELPLILQGQKR